MSTQFNTIIPILYSADIKRSLSYYTDILGFEDKWEWGNPPTFGGVHKNGIEIFFCENGQGHPGTWFSVMVNDTDEYYESIKAKGAKILSAPQSMEWGIQEMLVEDPDGHKIRFGHSVSRRKKSQEALPETVRIIESMPAAGELNELMIAAGWLQPGEDIPAEISLTGIVFVVLAEDTASNKVVGCAFLLSDNAGFYYVKNVIVHPAWQGKRVGTALMQAVTDWLDKNAKHNAMVALHTGENLAPFYRQFGFSKAFSMHRFIRRT